MTQARKQIKPAITTLKGAGGKTLERLEKLGIRHLQDLLFHLPLRYEDRTQTSPLAGLSAGLTVLVEGQVEHVELTGTSRRSLICRIGDGTGHLNLRFFHFSADQMSRLKHGVLLSVFGEVREGYFGLEMVHPEYQAISPGEPGLNEDRLTPVYPLTEGLHQRQIRRLIAQALALVKTSDQLPDWLPGEICAGLGFGSLLDSLELIHHPPAGFDRPALEHARRRLSYEELLAHHLSVGRLRSRVRQIPAPCLRLPPADAERFRAALPFPLTEAQSRVIGEILADLAQTAPMMRLLQGDVGAGKTVVAAFAALAAVASGEQVAIMAPTELLAEQHQRNFAAWLTPLGIPHAFLSGKGKGAARAETLRAIESGSALVVIGTHALFQSDVRFHSLGLVIIDEQHRFGVDQRLALREKGRENGRCPHQLIMTATPIPRTLAMLDYADLDISILDQIPPGRTPVKTSVLPASRRPEVIERIGAWVANGRQAYWVCTLIEESELLQCEAAENTAQALAAALPALRVGLLHGRMKAAEKDETMKAFQRAEIDLLVATTVIEVGVDVPNAGLMIIENPERLGLAQLHQLRGRVGRGPGESHCLLLYQPPLGAQARERLGILRETTNGFVIAERDRQLRGPGELLGIRQTGMVQFRIADLQRDGDLLDRMKETARLLLEHHPESVEHLIQRWLAGAESYVEV